MRILNELKREYYAEVYSALIYKIMADKATAKNYDGTAKWLEMQTDEECGHAAKFNKYIRERFDEEIPLFSEKVKIAGDKTSFSSLKELFEKILEHEKFVTKNIKNLETIANLEDDRETVQFLQWFVYEQGREEMALNKILHDLEIFDENKYDKILGSRKPEN